MRTNLMWVKRVAGFWLVLIMGASMSANAGLFGIGGTSWKEEVLLHDGGKIVVERSVERGGPHEIGQKPPFKWQSLKFTMPVTGEHVTWEDSYSEDIGTASFLPMLLDVQQGVVYLVADTMGCLSYNKWGRPNPPYVVFKYQDKEWKRIPLQELPAEIKTPNLIFSSPDETAKKTGENPVSAIAIQEIIAGYPQPQYRTILREAMPNVGKECIQTDYYKGAGWLSRDWFTDQPSLDACLKFCYHKNIADEICPCKAIYKGK